MSPTHKHFITELKRLEPSDKSFYSGDSYTGSGHFYYGVSVPERRRLLKDWLKTHKEARPKEIITLADNLFHGRSHEEKTMGAYLLSYAPKARVQVKLTHIDTWLGKLAGWAEIDAFCQNVWQPEELLTAWKTWKQFLIKLSHNKNINKRRASLVFLVGPTAKSDDERLHKLAYRNIEVLKPEKDILITKAISWLLRSMADTRPQDVGKYLRLNKTTLPAIAVRETKKKLLTGKKN